MSLFTRRSLIRIAGASAAVGVLRPSVDVAADKAVTIGIDLSLTGADAETAVRIRDGFTMAIHEANAKDGADGYHLNVLLLDDGTATAGQYDPDYMPALTKIKALGAQSIYYGGDAQAGVKLAKQAYDLVPNLIKAGGDGMYGPSILQGAGFPAADGWYATVASPHMMEDAELQPWVTRFIAKNGRRQPSDYSITAYDAALVVIDAIERVAKSGKPVERIAVRDAIRQQS
jgi:ABC-type branched-subunit amino acid transport system substrate-binding protein